MNRKSLFPSWIAAVCFCLVSQPAMAQAEDPDLELRVYRVTDLLVPSPSYPYAGGALPTTAPYTLPTGMGGVGMRGMGMGGMAGAAGSYGPGVLGSDVAPMFEFSIEELIDAITGVVAPTTWEVVGGSATCTRLGPLLLITQTPANHKRIKDLLAEIRSQGGTKQTMIVEAYWLLLDSDGLAKLSATTGSATNAAGRIIVNPPILEAMIRAVPGYRGRITCFSGQTVHLVSGSRRSVVIGAIPVVGSSPAYQPIMASPNIGVLLEVNPSLLPGTETAVLDLRSTVTGWHQPDPPLRIGGSLPPGKVDTDPRSASPVEVAGGTASITVDRVNLPTQQLATTLRVPLGKPVLVGGLTVSPTEPGGSKDQAEERKQLYLIVRTSRCEDDQPAPPAKAKPAAARRSAPPR